MQRRRRLEQTTSFKDRLEAFADTLNRKAKNLAPGSEREELEKKVRQAETAARINDWFNSPELRPPK